MQTMHFIDVSKYLDPFPPDPGPRRNRLTRNDWRYHFKNREYLIREPWRLRKAKDRTYLSAICQTPSGTLRIKVPCNPATGQPKGRILLTWRDSKSKRWRPAAQGINSGSANWFPNLIQRTNDALLPGGPKQS
jgi:hypothetical protein